MTLRLDTLRVSGYPFSVMKRCQFCGAQSTIHLTDIQDAVRREMHLCERCGIEHELIPGPASAQLNLPALLKLLLSEVPAVLKAAGAVDAGALTCPHCGLKYAQFRAAGRLGCPEDYEVFREPLAPLLERIHRGLDHAGKAPRRRSESARRGELERRLATAISGEDYELAARIRDELKELA